jgi:DNA helicase-2/ATP-dependent DNA helicase PcrA
MEEGLFPYRHRDPAGDHHEERQRLEEERRLCYVAMTRARRRLWLFHARRRQLFGGEQVLPPSRFLGDLPREVVEEAVLPGARNPSAWAGSSDSRHRAWPRQERRAEDGARSAQPWDVAPSPTMEQEICQAVAEEAGLSFQVGDKVRHVRFGVGRVVDIESGAEVKISVEFPGWGRKKLIGRFVERA